MANIQLVGEVSPYIIIPEYTFIYQYICLMPAICFVSWSKRGSNDNTTRKWVIRNILKENRTYINDSWEKLLLSLTQSQYYRSWWRLAETDPRLGRRELSRYMSHEGQSISWGHIPTLCLSLTFNLSLSICLCVCLSLTIYIYIYSKPHVSFISVFYVSTI